MDVTDAAMDAPADEPGARRRRWPTVVGYVVTAILFLGATGLRWEAAAGAAIWAAIIRGAYVAIRKRRGRNLPFFSPWAILLASFCAAASLAGITASENQQTDRTAVRRGIVTAGATVTPRDRCMTKILRDADTLSATQRAAIPHGVSLKDYARTFCERADSLGALATVGDINYDEALVADTCVEGMVQSFEAIAPSERRFSSSDFRKFSNRYCTEALRRGLVENARSGEYATKLQALRDSIVAEMLKNGEIHELS